MRKGRLRKRLRDDRWVRNIEGNEKWHLRRLTGGIAKRFDGKECKVLHYLSTQKEILILSVFRNFSSINVLTAIDYQYIMKDREVLVELSGTQSHLNPHAFASVFQLKNLPGTAVQTYINGL
jgi:hypothetical protein